jgi:hypothetical protein
MDPLRTARRRCGGPEAIRPGRTLPMLDALLLALGLGVFALMVAYAAGCDRV